MRKSALPCICGWAAVVSSARAKELRTRASAVASPSGRSPSSSRAKASRSTFFICPHVSTRQRKEGNGLFWRSSSESCRNQTLRHELRQGLQRPVLQGFDRAVGLPHHRGCFGNIEVLDESQVEN